MIELALPYRPRANTSERLVLGRRYPARVARQLALAHALQKRVDDGEFADYAEMARALGLSRARMTQLMDLLLLAPSIQEELLQLECPAGCQPLPERSLRRITRSPLWSEQHEAWRNLKKSRDLPDAA